MTGESILDRLPDGVVVVGPDRAIAQMNGAAERLTGWSRDEAIGRPYGDVLRLRHAAGFLVHERADPFAVAPKGAELFPPGHVPEHRGVVGERSGEQGPIGAEGERGGPAVAANHNPRFT